MPFRRLGPLVFAAMAVAAGASCDDPLSPAEVAGTYILGSVHGESPPAVLWENDDMRMRLLAATLRLNADGTGTEIWVYEFTNTLGTRAESWEERFQFEVHDRRLEGVYICPPSSFCLAVVRPIRGVFTLRGLRLDISKQGEAALEYVRVDE